jgi:hypothetical protein
MSVVVVCCPCFPASEGQCRNNAETTDIVETKACEFIDYSTIDTAIDRPFVVGRLR